VPFQAFPTADGWIVVACAKEMFFARLVTALGRPELSTDPRFVDFSARGAHAGQLQDLLDEIFTTRPVTDWLEMLRAAGVPCGPVNDVAQALLDPQTRARDLIVTTEHPHFGRVEQVASPVRVGSAIPTYRRAPQLHEDADQLLGSLLHLDGAAIRGLADQGAFGVIPG